MAHFSAFFKAHPKNHVNHANHHDLTINSPQQNHAFSRDPLQKLQQNGKRSTLLPSEKNSHTNA
jgi:hypothetical protein